MEGVTVLQVRCKGIQERPILEGEVVPDRNRSSENSLFGHVGIVMWNKEGP